jgi:hypothetical protein
MARPRDDDQILEEGRVGGFCRIKHPAVINAEREHARGYNARRSRSRRES